MRASKHVTHSLPDAQEVFEVSIARLKSEDVALPVAATTEAEAITLFLWNQQAGKWTDARVSHVPIATERGGPAITNTWNWSRRVGLATAKDRIYLVYKRAFSDSKGDPSRPALFVETFEVRNDGSLQSIQRIPVPMPMFTISGSGSIVNPILRLPGQPGFELWAGIDLDRERLLIVTQILGERATSGGEGAELRLFTGDLSSLDQEASWRSNLLEQGGYGLDVRHTGDKLTIVHRKSSHSVKVPLPIGQIDPFFAGSPQLRLDASAAADQNYTPLQIVRVDLPSLAVSKLDFPGGEHPRIQNVEPLLVVAERPELRVRFRLRPNAAGVNQPNVEWELGRMNKAAWLFDNNDRIAAGVLIALDGNRLPRPMAPWVNTQDLYTAPALDGVKWASSLSRFPLEPLNFGAQEKGFFFDFLHKSPLLGLNRSRAELLPDFDQGVLEVRDLRTELYDLNHSQIGPPADLTPDATGENAQFAPFERLSQDAGDVFLAPSYDCDNTIGGAAVADRDGVPYQFFAYTDLGDGGLRVIFDADLGPPGKLPPTKKPKALEPEAVPGPRSFDEQWIELPASEFQDARVPAIALASDARMLAPPTLTSSRQAQIESLLQVGATVANLPIDFENNVSVARWSEDQINSVQTELNRLVPGNLTRTETGVTPPAFIQVEPPGVVARAESTWEAGITGENVADVQWRFTPPPINPAIPNPVDPLTIFATGRVVRTALFTGGNWTVRADITRTNGTVRTFETVVTVTDSLFRAISALHRELSEQEPDPAISALGSFQVGTATFNFLQYELHFPVDADDTRARAIEIRSLDRTDAEWRFRGNGVDQGLVDYRLRIRFESEDIRLRGLLAALLKIESIEASFFYGRSFTPGILMNDTRSAAAITGAEAAHDTLHRGDKRLASCLTAKPHSNAQVVIERIRVKVSMLPQAVAAAVVTLLIGLGAATAAATLLFLLSALGVAIAAAAIPGAGVAAAAAVVAATIAVFLFINFAVPPLVETAIAASVENGLRDQDQLDESRLLQFAGEGLAEAVAQQVIAKAIESGANLTPAASAADSVGDDRFRQDLFQMIHVSDGLCRVLIRG